MVGNVYLKAAVVTLLVFLAWLAVVLYIDYDRNTAIQASLEEAFFELEGTKVLFLYADQAGNSDVLCTAIESKLDTQLRSMGELAGRLAPGSGSDLSRDTYTLLKKRFVIANAEALYYLNRLSEQCNKTTLNPVLFFYQESGYCPACDAQGAILDNIRDHCSDVRIFPFPVDTDVEVANLIRDQEGITSAPAVVIGDTVYLGLQSSGTLSGHFTCAFDN